MNISFKGAKLVETSHYHYSSSNHRQNAEEIGKKILTRNNELDGNAKLKNPIAHTFVLIETNLDTLTAKHYSTDGDEASLLNKIASKINAERFRPSDFPLATIKEETPTLKRLYALYDKTIQEIAKRVKVK